MSKLTIIGLVVGGIVGVVLFLLTKDIGLVITEFLTINILVQAVRIAQNSSVE
ncbi:MAG: hypothetical protein HDR05_12490 [Lachnospiraceae bacterium]|nr:hypothetical protein [Lachnospiraceae bacterium]